MNKSTIWAISLGAGIPGLLILLGIIAILVKFFYKRFRKRPWDDINTLPKDTESTAGQPRRTKPVRLSSIDHDSMHASGSHREEAAQNPHVVIPIPDDLPHMYRRDESGEPPILTLVQVQRDRLNQLKEEGSRLRPMIPNADVRNDIQLALDEAQKEFDRST